MVIKQATLDDLELLVPLFDGYRMFYQQASDVALARAFLQQHFHQQTSVIFLALPEASEGKALGRGMGFTQLYRSFSSVAARHVWILNDLFVAPHARRQGVARALMEAARAFAKTDGALKLMLETAADNSQAQALYEDLGYQQEQGVFHYSLKL